RVFSLPPNDTVTFIHESPWVPTENRVYELSVWFDLLDFDVFAGNDTLTVQQGIGTATSIDVRPQIPITLYPNPAQDELFIGIDTGVNGWRIELRDLTGRLIQEEELRTATYQMSIVDIPDGIYMVRMIHTDGTQYAQKIRVAR
ncbi:MAG: T9SS type A sorting domain-containing protein, partial [Bacteroidota bacterium]